MKISWMPSIGSMFSCSSLTLVFYGIFVFLIGFMYSGQTGPAFQQLIISSLPSGVGSQVVSQLPTTLFGFLGTNVWISAASFTSVSSSITPTLGAALPPGFLYYLVLFGSGALASLIALRKESKIIDAILSPLIASLYIVVMLLIVSYLMGSMVPSTVQGGTATVTLGALSGLFTLSAVDYILIYIISYLFFMIGTLTVAGIKVLITHSISAEKPAPKTKKMFCKECGFENRSAHKFCKNCGSELVKV